MNVKFWDEKNWEDNKDVLFVPLTPETILAPKEEGIFHKNVRSGFHHSLKYSWTALKLKLIGFYVTNDWQRQTVTFILVKSSNFLQCLKLVCNFRNFSGTFLYHKFNVSPTSESRCENLFIRLLSRCRLYLMPHRHFMCSQILIEIWSECAHNFLCRSINLINFTFAFFPAKGENWIFDSQFF